MGGSWVLAAVALVLARLADDRAAPGLFLVFTLGGVFFLVGALGGVFFLVATLGGVFFLVASSMEVLSAHANTQELTTLPLTRVSV